MPFAAIGERDLAVENLVLLDHAQAAALPARAAGILAQRHAMDADRRLHLHRLDRQVHAVGDVGLDDVDAVGPHARAAAASDQFPGDERRAASMPAAERQDHQLARAVGRHPFRQHFLEGTQDTAGDALDGGRPGIDRRRLGRIDDAALGQLERDGAEAAGIGPDRRVRDGTHRIARRRERARRHAVERPPHLAKLTLRNSIYENNTI